MCDPFILGNNISSENLLLYIDRFSLRIASEGLLFSKCSETFFA